MKTSTLLCLALLLLAASPFAGAWSSHISCGSEGSSYAANSTYEANLRGLAAVITAEAAASPGQLVDRAVGFWPNRPRAVARCLSGGHGDDCATCLADAFKRVETECPFIKDATFFSWNCSLSLSEVRISGTYLFVFGGGSVSVTQILVMGMVFQAVGLACLFIKFLQTWHHDTKRRTIMYANTGSPDSKIVGIPKIVSTTTEGEPQGPRRKSHVTAQEA